MEDSTRNIDGNQPKLKISIFARMMIALSYIIPAIGGAISSFLLMRVFQLLSANETAGMSVIMASIKDASTPAIISLYLGVILGIIAIGVLLVRLIVPTKTASPPIWFFMVGFIVCLLPAGLFWVTKWMVLEVISPGSSASLAGIGRTASNISLLSTLSIIAAPVLILIFILLSLLPFSSRSKSRASSIAAASIIEILLIVAAIGIPFFIREPKKRIEMVNLPVASKSGDTDNNLEKNNATVLTLSAENKLYLRQIRELAEKVERSEIIITKEELPERIKTSMEGKTPDRRIVYFKCDAAASFENILKIFEIIRNSDIDKVSLVVVSEKNKLDPYETGSIIFEVRLPLNPVDAENAPVKPNPLILVAMLENAGKLTLNRDDMGMISDSKKLESKLIEVFKEREFSGVFREGTNEIEKSIFVKVAKSSKYGDFIKLVESLKVAGSEPITLQLDSFE